MSKQLRAVVGARVSVLKGDEKVSHVAQRESGVRWATSQGWPIVGEFEDLDVSATVSPFDRPDLGPWLTDEQAYSWDVMIWSKIDRAFRDPRDAVNVAYWAEQRKKVLVFSDDGLTLDFRDDADPMARMMAETFLLMGSIFGKWELRRFQERARDGQAVIKRTNRFKGGTPPEGYKTAPNPDGEGRVLVPDPTRQKMLWDVKERLLGEAESAPAEGDSLAGITIWLNGQGVETRKDYLLPKGKKKGTQWNVIQVVRMLTSEATQGMKLTGKNHDTYALDDNGDPIRMAESTFDDQTWKKIQIAVEKRRNGKANRVNQVNPLLNVTYCGKCESPAYRWVKTHNGTHYMYYKCSRMPRPCAGVSLRAQRAVEIVEDTFLYELGGHYVTEWVFVPGEDHTDELEKLHSQIDRLRRDRDDGLYDGPQDHEKYREMMQGKISRRRELEALPQRAAGWAHRQTSETYRQAWHRSDEQGRRRLLVDAGIKLYVNGKNDFHVFVPQDVIERNYPGYDAEQAHARRRVGL